MAFPLSAASLFHKVRLLGPGTVTRRIMTGDGSGQVAEVHREAHTFIFPDGEGQCSAEGLTFPKAESERVQTLMRVNGWRTAMLFGSFGILPYQIIRGRHTYPTGSTPRAIIDSVRTFRFRHWKPIQRCAVPHWSAEHGPLFSRFSGTPSLFPSAAELRKLRKVRAEARNSAADFLALTPAKVQNRVRTSSPRWRGAGNHAQRKYLYTRPAKRVPAPVNVPAKHTHTPIPVLVLGVSVEKYAKWHIQILQLAKGAKLESALSRHLDSFRRRVRELARKDLKAVRDLFRAIRELKAEAGTYAGYIGVLLAESFQVYLEETTEQDRATEQIPRPPYLLPLPPSAPLAPPA